jgi:hypothetical protein
MCMSRPTARPSSVCACGVHVGLYSSHSATVRSGLPRQPLTSAKPGKERSPEAAAQSASDPTRSMS